MRVKISPAEHGVPPDLGAPRLPGSKSHTQRAMLLAGETPSLLRGALVARDTEVLGRALARLGAEMSFEAEGLRVRGLRPGASGEVDLDENGTALRMLLVVVPMLGGWLRLDGAPGLRARPIGAALELLAHAGAEVGGEALPLSVDGKDACWPERIEVDARQTTQVASGALIGLALRLRGGLATPPSELRAIAPAAPGYLRVTARLLEAFGFSVAIETEQADLRLRILAAPRTSPAEILIPPDPSALAFPMALAALHGKAWTPPSACSDPHPDWQGLEVLHRLAAAPARQPLRIEDLGAHPDAFCALAVLAASRPGETWLCGAPALRAKESDRIAAMARGLSALGVACEELADGLKIRGPLCPQGPQQTPVALPSVADHRVVMALALLGTLLPGGVLLEHAEAVDKSWPGYFDWLAKNARVEAV